jgi:hypothetical protein
MAAAVPPPAFVALQLGEVAGPLDLTDANDRKYYMSAIKGLDENEKFNLSPVGLRSFLNSVRRRVELHCWHDVVNVPVVAGVGNLNILDQYGIVTMIDCTAHANAYYLARMRTAQNAVMLYHFLFSSVTLEAKSKLDIDAQSFTINGNKDGLTFLRAIISRSQLDTIGTVESLRRSIGNLPIKLTEVAGNIIEFHQHVNQVTGTLDSYVQVYPELITNLFVAYSLIEDTEFNTYVMMMKFDYRRAPNAFNVAYLMDGIENLYKIRIETETWKPSISNQGGATSNDISALTTETSQSKNKKREIKYAWKKIPPKAGEAKSKSYENRMYHWCVNHKAWTMHKPEECQGVNYKHDSDDNVGSVTANTTTVLPQKDNQGIVETDPQLRVKEAMMTLTDFGNDYME